MGVGLFVGSGAIKTDAVGQEPAMLVVRPGGLPVQGADLGILVTKGHMQPAEASHRTGPDYIAGSRGQYVTEPLADAPAVMPLSYVK